MSRVLIVEDELTLATAMQDTLRRDQITTEVVHDGVSAIAQIEAELHAGTMYDLVLLDLLIPEKNGFDVLDRLTELECKVPVVVLTNLSKDEYENRIGDNAVAKYLVKSDTSLDQLLDVVHTYL